MKKFALLLLVCLLVSLAMPAAQNPSVIAQSGITIWLTGDENQATALQNAAVAFTASSGIAVKVEAVAWGDAYSRYLTAVNSRSGADMFAGGMSWGISLGDVGGLVDLSQAYPDEYEEVLDMNNPAFVEAIIGVDGAVYGIPFNQDLIVMFYMPEKLAQVGFDAPPTTWEEFGEVVDALRAARLGGAGFAWGHASWIGFQAILAQAGGSWYADDCSAAAINSDEGLVALEYFTELYETYGFPSEEVSTGPSFATGELSITFDGEWTALGIDPSYPELAGQWAIAPLPAGPSGSGATFIGGKMIGIFSYSANADAAWEFIKWLQTEEATQGLTDESYNFGSLFIPTQIENVQYIKGNEMIVEALAAQLLETSGPPHCPGWEESNALINLELQGVLFDGNAYDDALIQMEAILNDALEDYGS